MNLILQVLPKWYHNQFKLSYITLLIRRSGTRIIFGADFPKDSYPDEVYINGNLQNNVKNSYSSFNQAKNVVKLNWNKDINNCYKMFYNCSDINEINLSNFDSSKVINMEGMFGLCRYLESIDLSNFDISKVTNMRIMFYRCDHLNSINLSSFNTSNVRNMEGMFYECSSLGSIDLSNFDTSYVTNMGSCF